MAGGCRKKARAVMELIGDGEKLREARERANSLRHVHTQGMGSEGARNPDMQWSPVQQARSPHTTHTAPPAGAKWECGRCTFHNEQSRRRCEMCDGEKGASVKFVMPEQDAALPRKPSKDGKEGRESGKEKKKEKKHKDKKDKKKHGRKSSEATDAATSNTTDLFDEPSDPFAAPPADLFASPAKIDPFAAMAASRTSGEHSNNTLDLLTSSSLSSSSSSSSAAAPGSTLEGDWTKHFVDGVTAVGAGGASINMQTPSAAPSSAHPFGSAARQQQQQQQQQSRASAPDDIWSMAMGSGLTQLDNLNAPKAMERRSISTSGAMNQRSKCTHRHS